MEATEAPPLSPDEAAAMAGALREQVGRAVRGQRAAIDHILVAFLAGGHVLLEGVPGVGKTLMVLSLARAIEGKFSRIQFTPDLMPSDVTGHALFDQATNRFRIRKGPVFTNLLLADEINRAPAKTQAALLEVMAERQVTIEGDGFTLSPPFMTLATQNPVEQEGTYPARGPARSLPAEGRAGLPHRGGRDSDRARHRGRQRGRKSGGRVGRLGGRGRSHPRAGGGAAGSLRARDGG
jgi:MoxR-like ATPase